MTHPTPEGARCTALYAKIRVMLVLEGYDVALIEEAVDSLLGQPLPSFAELREDRDRMQEKERSLLCQS